MRNPLLFILLLVSSLCFCQTYKFDLLTVHEMKNEDRIGESTIFTNKSDPTYFLKFGYDSRGYIHDPKRKVQHVFDIDQNSETLKFIYSHSIRYKAKKGYQTEAVIEIKPISIDSLYKTVDLYYYKNNKKKIIGQVELKIKKHPENLINTALQSIFKFTYTYAYDDPEYGLVESMVFKSKWARNRSHKLVRMQNINYTLTIE